MPYDDEDDEWKQTNYPSGSLAMILIGGFLVAGAVIALVLLVNHKP